MLGGETRFEPGDVTGRAPTSRAVELRGRGEGRRGDSAARSPTTRRTLEPRPTARTVSTRESIPRFADSRVDSFAFRRRSDKFGV